MSIASVVKDILTGAFKIRQEAFWVLVGQLGTAVGVLIGVKVLTQVLDPYEFGRLTLANTIILLVGTNVFGPLGQGFMRFWSIAHGRGQVHGFAKTVNRYARFLTSIVLGLSLIWLMMTSVLKWSDWSLLIWLSLVVGSFTGLFGLRLSVFLAARKRIVVALVNTAVAFLKPLTAVILVVLLSSSANWVMGAYLMVTALTFLVVEKHYGKLIQTTLSNYRLIDGVKGESDILGREILSFSWPFCLWGMFGWIHQSCDRWSLQIFHGPDVVGAFSVISILATYPFIFGANFLSNLFIPMAYDRAGNLTSLAAIQSANNILYLMAAVYVVGACILITAFLFLHNEVVLLMSNMRYMEYAYLLPGLSIAWGIFYLGQMFSGFGLLANKPKKCILPIVVSAVIAAIMTSYFSKRYGPVGVVWALSISSLVYAVWFMAVGFRLSSSIRLNAG